MNCSTPAADRPPTSAFLPVTLILLTYNHERFVAEAVASALAQDHEGLELVISDHGSTDRTCEIVDQMVAAYAGPHRVIIHRSRAKGGVFGHARDAVARSNGALIVGAAGDDVSRPDRVRRLAQRWKNTGAALLWSAVEAIDEAGRPLPSKASAPLIHDAARYFPGGGVSHIRGAAAAYDRRAFEAVDQPTFDVMAEDLLLSLMIGLQGGRFEYLHEPLVRYRHHSGAQTQQSGAAPTLEAAERATARYSLRAAQVLRHFEQAAISGGGKRQVDLARVRADAAYHQARSEWLEAGFRRRLAALRWARSRAQLRWMLPRLFGMRALTL